MTLVYAKQLDFQISKTKIRAQKIDGSLLEIFWIAIAGFQVINKLGKL